MRERKARRTDPATSHEAARRAKQKTPTQKEQIVASLTAAAVFRFPKTAEEISESTGIRLNSVSTRMSELVGDGRVRVCGTSKGRLLYTVVGA